MLYRKLALPAFIVSTALITSVSSISVQAQEPEMEETVVIAKKTTYANSLVNESMVDQQSSMTSVLAVIDNLPGVLINEGDVFGSDDWSTTVSMRGFQISLDEQQIGMTIDGVPNGNSNYGGGSKANRFVDTENLETVNVSQGTTDIASRSHEALGGTLDFITKNPEEEERLRFSVTTGDYSAKKYYVRYDTGMLWDNTKAYFTYSDSDVKAWIDESGESIRTHMAGKFISELGLMTITGYAAYDDTEEDNYQRVTVTEFNQNSDWDRLTGDWVGIPYIDQLYRRGWSTLRENLLAYTKFEFNFENGINAQVTPYYHDNSGRGDWVPPYIVDVNSDGLGNPQSEVVSPQTSTVSGGGVNGLLFFVDNTGRALSPTPGCESSITFPYGGAGPEYDANCYATGAIPVSSYRQTQYEKERFGFTADIDWTTEFSFGDNLLRAGIWYEDYKRKESREWHKIIDSKTSYHYDETPYWIQYDREYPIDTLMVYLEDSVTIGDVSLRLGGKQWYVDLERKDNFDSAGSTSVSSDSNFLLNAGVLWQATDNLELFTGYAENYAAIKDVVLEAADLVNSPNALNDIEPETADNFDIGLRYSDERFLATATYYDIQFENRITFIPPIIDGNGDGQSNGNDYLNSLGGTYQNVGGIESNGLELSGTWFASEKLSVYASYTKNDSTYLGTGNTEVDSNLGIFVGNTVFGSAEDMYVLSLDWNSGPYRAGISSKHVGERWMDKANKSRVDAYNVSDLYVSIVGENIGDKIKAYELRFTINNLFDEDYIGGVAGGYGGWIGGGRTAAFNFQLDF